MENFQELRDPKNPRGVNRFGLATKVVYATFGLLAIVLGIVALVKCDNLKKAHDIHVAEMQQGTGKIESYEIIKNRTIEANLLFICGWCRIRIL